MIPSARKNVLRKQLKTARLTISEIERESLSRQICNKLGQTLNWSDIKTIHIYEPILKLGEVNINEFMDRLKHEYVDVSIFTSRKINENWEVVGLNSPNLVFTKFDVAIVPLLGFDDWLQRIGYGGGYYDKFLGSNEVTLKIGVGFDLCKINRVPVEDHDVPLDMVVTESKIYR